MRLQRISLHATYAQQLVAGTGSTGPELAARCVAYIYAMTAGLCAAAVSYLASYTHAATAVFAFHAALAAAAANWPAAAEKPAPRWVRWARAWAHRAKELVAFGGESLEWRQKNAASRIQGMYRGARSRKEMGRLRAATLRVQSGFREESFRRRVVPQTCMGRLYASTAGALLAQVERMQAALTRLGARVHATLMRCSPLQWLMFSLGWYVALGLQMTMASSASLEFHKVRGWRRAHDVPHDVAQ